MTSASFIFFTTILYYNPLKRKILQPLVFIAFYSLVVFRYLLEANADVNAQTQTGDTALTYACENGHTEVAKLLLQYGADLVSVFLCSRRFNAVGISLKAYSTKLI